MILNFNELFIFKSDKKVYSKQELITLKLSPNFIKQMEGLLNLSYLENTNTKGNLCFANNSDVLSEFRTVFTKMDIIFYISATLNKVIFKIEKDKIQFPSCDANFWIMVKKGSLLK